MNIIPSKIPVGYYAEIERPIQNLQGRYKESRIVNTVFCLAILLIAESGVLKSPSRIVDLPISPFNPVVTSTAWHFPALPP